jgi:alpha,alpha-trehalase
VAWQWVRSGGEVPAHLWRLLSRLTDQATERWDTPDAGPWEIRDTGRPFT